MEDFLVRELSILHNSQIHSVKEVYFQGSLSADINKGYFLCESNSIRLIHYSTLETSMLVPFEKIKRLVLD